MSLLAFLGGFGSGYVAQQERNRQNKREDMRDEMYAQRFAWEKDDAERKKQDRLDADALEQARIEESSVGTVVPEYAVEHQGDDGQTVSVPQPSAGDAEFTAFMQNAAKPEGATNYPETKVAQNYSVRQLDGTKKIFTGLDAAKQAAEYIKANPVSEVDRLNATSLRLKGMRGGLQQATQLQQQAIAAENLQIQRDKIAKELQKENAYEALAHFSRGNTKGGIASFAKSGFYNLDPETTTSKEVIRDIPGIGPTTTYQITGHLIGKDGSRQPININTYDEYLKLEGNKEAMKLAMEARKAANDEKKLNATLKVLGAQEKVLSATANQKNTKASEVPRVGLSDIRTFNSDFANLLPKPADDINADPEKVQALQDANLDLLTKGQTIFQANAGIGQVLTAPVVLKAMRLAANPKNLSEPVVDKQTGLLVQYVNVGGIQVIAKSSVLQKPKAGQ